MANRPKLDKATRDGIKRIREAMAERGESASEAEAIALAVRAVSDPTVVFMKQSDFAAVMASYAANAVSIALGSPHVPVDMGNGTIGFAAVDGDMPEAPRAH